MSAPSRCRICANPELREAVDAVLRRPADEPAVEARFNLPHRTVYRHRIGKCDDPGWRRPRILPPSNAPDPLAGILPLPPATSSTALLDALEERVIFSALPGFDPCWLVREKVSGGETRWVQGSTSSRGAGGRSAVDKVVGKHLDALRERGLARAASFTWGDG
ncbi:MAG: hypothetical protein AB1679_12165 [Actinomycetota bacterium]